ncbi:DUF1642 domain-containing protein [Enterococcus mundtii]|uniref:DUF1642 domain-containing protein n=1 Tax=Enterococcus mundtii TaxID=53346 RepID=UPI001FB86845|nr:DUF1642 domain-containing protein [Enterococcus mundtii]GKS56444.1 hypothetical protein EMLAB_30590 [Enterococcus mundtii]
MSKQELIEKIKKAITDELSRNYFREVDNYGYTEYEYYTEEDARGVANDIILDLEEDLKQLADEPQKPVVPKFAADWIEYAKKKGDSLAISFKWKLYGVEYSKADRWIEDNQETFARAWLDGYEVEKEPLYRVKIGEGYFVEYQGRGALIMPDKNKEIKIFDSKSEAERTSSTIGGTVEEVSEKDEI